MIVLQLNTHRLVCRTFDFTSNFQDGGHGVISRRKVLPSAECIPLCSSVRRLPASNSVYSSWSTVLSDLFLKCLLITSIWHSPPCLNR